MCGRVWSGWGRMRVWPVAPLARAAAVHPPTAAPRPPTRTIFSPSTPALPPGPARGSEFVRLWTLKEAHVKATGLGIARSGLSTFDVRLADHAQAKAALEAALPGLPARRGGARAVVFCESGGKGGAGTVGRTPPPRAPSPAAWRFALLAPSPDHAAAVCVGRAPPPGEGVVAEPRPPPLRVRCWRTLPLVRDGPLPRGATALAVSVEGWEGGG